MMDLRLCRTLLFLPASNPRAIEKARGLDADMIVLDLEDAVKPEDKAAAREAAVAAVRTGFGGRPAAIRINVAGSAWYGEDVVKVRGSGVDCIVLPKTENRRQVHDLIRLVERPVLAMVETAAGVIAATDIAREAAALVAGTNDLAADLGIPPGAGRAGLTHALQSIVLAARSARAAAFDGVYNRLEDDAGLAAECEEGRRYGFDGKSLIHPSQIDTANRLFSPGEAEIDAALRLIAAATGGAERHEGRMIESMHVHQAQALLAKARR
jgi:(3S)-malyl-CoA thioesterase